MFTGIIEALGNVVHLEREGTNLQLTVASDISKELKIDQSVAHNGVCLTVVSCDEYQHTVTIIEESLNKTNLAELKVDSLINLERCMRADARFDGHMVQGHVDAVARCLSIEDRDGSRLIRLSYPTAFRQWIVEKGSICLNGISLTVFDLKENEFSIAVIPYTLEHTNLKQISPGSTLNIEFDIIGKYIARKLELSDA